MTQPPERGHRHRRRRYTQPVREALAETRVDPASLVEPHFVVPGSDVNRPIEGMDGVPQVSPDVLVERVREGLDLGIRSILLFGVPESEDPQGRAAADPEGPVPTALRRLDEEFGDELFTMADVCLCAYTTHGHCGVVDEGGHVVEEASLDRLAEAAVAYAEAGADWVAPSDMLDGRVAAIRSALDQAGHERAGILSYSAKFASAFYGPFRHAQESAPAGGDRSSYQLNPPNAREAMRAVERDVDEGADAVMVKPGLAYLDILYRVSQRVDVPVAAYNVSGEHGMATAGDDADRVELADVVPEILTAYARAGADLTITYHARQAVQENWI